MVLKVRISSVCMDVLWFYMVHDLMLTELYSVFWTPSEPTEVLVERDVIVDFPELITL